MNDTQLRFVEAFKALEIEINRNAIDHGFYEDELQRYFTCDSDGNFKQIDLSKYFKGNRIALQHSELSEGLEAIRTQLPTNIAKMDEHCPQFRNLEVELADCVIRIMDMACFYGLDVAGAIIAKHNFNISRPYKHGKTM